MNCAFQSLAGTNCVLGPVLTPVLLLLASAVYLNAASFNRSVSAHVVAEITFTAAQSHANPFQDVTLDAVFHSPGSTQPLRVPAFWAGANQWKVRYASGINGRHTFVTECSDTADTGLHAVRGAVEITPYLGTNTLHRHGPLQLSGDRGHFVHADGTPFFWLADSWWHGMTTRLPWPDGFQLLVEDRRAKGFSVIQFAVAFPCDIEPFDDRGANEAGHAWTPGFGTIRPEYFDRTDKRIEWLVRRGLVPNVVGAWGYYLPFMGTDRMKQHWRYLIARYGAYPVTWTLCGESTLIWYQQPGTREELEAHRKQQVAGWTEVARFIRQTDPFHRLLTVHPGPASGRFRPIEDMQLLDFVMLQPGHSDFETLPVAIQHQRRARELFPSIAVLMGEVCFEGMQGGACGPKIQRNLFWTSVLSGAPGFCYGVDALWQFNTRTRPFGPSPGGQIWGNAPWEEAYQWPGSRHLGLGRRILERYAWWRMEPHPEWIEPAGDAEHPLEPFTAGIPGELRLVYFPRHVAPWSKPYHVVGLEPDVTCAATYIDPLTGDRHPLPPVVPDANRRWRVPPAPILQDWLLEVCANSAREKGQEREAASEYGLDHPNPFPSGAFEHRTSNATRLAPRLRAAKSEWPGGSKMDPRSLTGLQPPQKNLP